MTTRMIMSVIKDQKDHRPHFRNIALWLMRVGGALVIWQIMVTGLKIPSFLLPSPQSVVLAFWKNAPLLGFHGLVTLAEMVGGLFLAFLLAVICASLLFLYPRLAKFLLPYLIAGQALPVFALAPLLTLWLGFGIGSKLIMAIMIMYFPIFSAFYDGLCHPRPEYIWLGQSFAVNRWQDLRFVRFPAALPQLASGLRIAAVAAPIGAVVGEWVGAEAGLGYFMLHANGLMRTADLFAALLLLMGLSFVIFRLVGLFAIKLTRFAE